MLSKSGVCKALWFLATFFFFALESVMKLKLSASMVSSDYCGY